jgi:NAD(P)-dependent dehydrogenase (short-subunit alcohol dehydrogenase family)
MSTEDKRTVIITGASQGLGYFAALNLARDRPGWHIVMACRAPLDKATNAAAAIIAESGNKNVEVAELNLASLESVRKFASDILPRLERSSKKSKRGQTNALPPLTAVVCNAGAQFVNNQKSAEGFEATFGAFIDP